MTTQKPSRLELYVEILNALGNQPQMKFTDLRQKTRIDNESLLYAINFLEKQGLITSGNVENETVYHNTPRGLIVAKFFANRKQVVPQEDYVCGNPNPESDYSL
jgi:predicted transcriptional regulator